MVRIRSTLVLIAGVLVCTSYQSDAQQVPARRLVWETLGGGTIVFDVVRDGDNFEIHLTNYQHKRADQRIPLTREEAQAYQLVTDIFERTRDLANDTFVPRGPTGSWTTITLVTTAGESLVYRNIEAWGHLALLPTFVQSRMAPVRGP